MSDIQYNLQFEKLCSVLQLGKLVAEPEAISGGLLHRMYAIETTQGRYAVKALNPQIMLRPMVMQHLINSEQIANNASKNISAVTAKIFNGTSVQEIDRQFYLVFDWVDGGSLKQNEINAVNCEKIGATLASIHMTDFSKLGIDNEFSGDVPVIDWNYYLNKGQENKTSWVNLMLEMKEKLYELCAQANESARLLASDMVISHRDLDSKNVMWNQGDPIIIDWESAGYVNPMKELIETAVYWSEDEKGDIDKVRFKAFIDGYKKKYGALQADWKAVLASGFLGKLEWLEYSLKRSLRIECSDEEEQRLGTSQVTGTINAINRYAAMIPELEKWLNVENEDAKG